MLFLESQFSMWFQNVPISTSCSGPVNGYHREFHRHFSNHVPSEKRVWAVDQRKCFISSAIIWASQAELSFGVISFFQCRESWIITSPVKSLQGKDDPPELGYTI